MPTAAVSLAKKTFRLQAKQMHRRSSGPRSARCSARCQRTSSAVDPSARRVRGARWREFKRCDFQFPLAERSHFKLMSQSCRHICLHRGANFPNTVRSQTAPGSPFWVVPPVPATMCTSKRPVKSFSPPPVKRWSLATITKMMKPLPCKMNIWDACWSWVQVNFANRKKKNSYHFVSCSSPICCSPS